MTRVRVGIVGMGGAGQAHARRFSSNPRVSSLRSHDVKRVDVPGVEFVAQREPFYEGVDAVSICTPDHLHLEFAVEALTLGKHVLVEKPMVASLAQAEALQETIAAHPDRVFAVHHQMRHIPAFDKARELIATGALGRVFYLEANYWHDMRERNTMYDDWRVREPSQSVVFGAACHPLDLMMHLAGGAPTSVSTFANKSAYPEYPLSYTSVTTLMQFENGITGKCHTNNCARFPQLNNLVVLGEEASYVDGILYRDGRFRVFPEVFDFGRGWAGRIKKRVFEWLANDDMFRMNPLSVYLHEVGCQIIVDNFMSAISGEEDVLVDFEEGKRVITLCERVEAQARLD